MAKLGKGLLNVGINAVNVKKKTKNIFKFLLKKKKGN